MNVLSRRVLLQAGMLVLPLAAGRARAQPASAAASAAGAVDALAAMRAMVMPAVNEACAWWFFGTLSAHVDGLREFPIALVESVRLCRSDVVGGDELKLSWVEIGCLRDLYSGAVASSWFNPFGNQSLPLPRSFIQGPGTYSISRASGGVAVMLDESMARVSRLSLTAQLSKGRMVLTLSETKIRSFPTLDGGRQAPDIALPDVTQDRTVCSFIGDADVVTRAPGQGAATGFYSTVYDDLPSWLGFGERLGGAIAKGVMRRAALGERVNPVTWKTLQKLHPHYFAHGKLQFPR
jgi:hypothetical protein